MRIISQLGMDFPYEQIIVFIDDNHVKCKPVSDMSAKSYLLGEYDTAERAKEVFNSINVSYYNIPLMEQEGALYNQTTFVMPEE